MRTKKRSMKAQQLSTNSQSGALHSQSSTRVSASNSDEELDPVSSILDVDSDHVMEPSDDEEGTRGTSENPIEMIDEWEDDEDAEAELRKTYLTSDKG
jgi:hypothetical protein